MRRALALALVILLAGAATAFAHATLVSTSPKRHAKLAHAPSSVSLTFSGPIRSGTVTVSGPHGTASVGHGGRDPRNLRRLLVKLRSGLGAGRYTVHASSKAADGHSQSWTYTFTVK